MSNSTAALGAAFLLPGFATLTLTKITAVLEGSTTGTATVTATIDGTPVTGGNVVISGSTSPGDIFTATPTANNVITAEAKEITFASDGGTTGAAPLVITVELEAN